MTTTTSDPKIIDLLNQHKDEEKTLLSLEFFPPRTDAGVKNLFARMDRMKGTVRPLFSDVTWGAGGSTSDLSLEIAKYLHDSGHVSNMHLTCTNMEQKDDNGNSNPILAVQQALASAYAAGIRNIVALRGDPPEGQDEWKATEGGFTCALDLVKYIRQEYGKDFGISVAGYPEGHPNAISQVHNVEDLSETEKGRSSKFDGVTYTCRDEDYQKEMAYLKQKVDAGADFIITQMFFDVEVFKTFCKDCRDMGMDVPIVPGLMCINAYPGFRKMTKFCKTRVPAWLDEKMESLQSNMNDNPDAIKAFGIEFGARVCQEIMDSNLSPVLHFYTLNLEKVVYGILDQIGLAHDASGTANEADANDMVAMGSAWARVGDTIHSIYGQGVVKEVRKGGVAVVEMNQWIMAGGQKPVAYLQGGQYKKVF